MIRFAFTPRICNHSNFQGEDYADMDKVAEQNDVALQASKNIVSKMKIAFKKRSLQADVVNKEINNSQRASYYVRGF